jgi:hypothetical protein
MTSLDTCSCALLPSIAGLLSVLVVLLVPVAAGGSGWLLLPLLLLLLLLLAGPGSCGGLRAERRQQHRTASLHTALAWCW